jgi:hypothetical protein
VPAGAAPDVPPAQRSFNVHRCGSTCTGMAATSSIGAGATVTCWGTGDERQAGDGVGGEVSLAGVSAAQSADRDPSRLALLGVPAEAQGPARGTARLPGVIEGVQETWEALAPGLIPPGQRLVAHTASRAPEARRVDTATAWALPHALRPCPQRSGARIPAPGPR